MSKNFLAGEIFASSKSTGLGTDYEAVKSWKTMSMAMTANAWANRRAMIIAVNILGALEGFLPNALMLAKLLAANTAQGPNKLKPNITTRAMFLDILFLYYYSHLILVNAYEAPAYGYSLFVEK